MPNSFDLDARGPSNRRLVVVGVCFALVAAASVVLAIAKSKGDLDRIVQVTAELVNVGDGLPQKSDVKFRGVLVGQVADVITATVGQPNVVHIHLKPEYARDIPATVTARVVPSNVFAVSSVQLVDNGKGGASLRPGAVIREDESLPTVLFQTTLNKFRQLFVALSRQPTDNGVGVLATITEATHGRGEQLREAGSDLNQIVAQLNTVVSDGSAPSTISMLTAATDALRDASPDLFDTLKSAVAPMKTLAEKRTALADFLSAGLHTVGTVGDAFDHQTDRLINITTQLTPVVGVLVDNDTQLHPIASRIQQLGQSMLNVYNPDTTQFTVKAIASLTPTRTYVRTDCPRYGELVGPSCHTAPEVPTAPGLYPALGSMGYPPPAGVTENRPNLAPPRDSTRHAGEVPGAPGQGSLPGPAAEQPSPPPADAPTTTEVPLPAEAGAPGNAVPQSAVIGGNVGPVGSPRETQQLSQIVGGEANAATTVLLGPVVRGSTVQITPDKGDSQ
jgi:phospholipid/cholesterol/gamma-HCH transport system substrate-binding protein